MTDNEVYLDNNATTCALPEVVETVMRLSGPLAFGNPSSSHARGYAARCEIARARDAVAALVGASESSVVFTSGGTESNNLALAFLFDRPETRRLIVSRVEHSSVSSIADALIQRGGNVVALGVDEHGLVNLEELGEQLASPTDCVAIQWANSETGVVQPIEAIADLCHARGVPLHVDAAQAVGRMPIQFEALPSTSLSFSGHKVHGPLGVGVLCVRDPRDLRPVTFGGDQERGARPGTENVPAIAGLGVAALRRLASMDEACQRMRQLRDRFEAQILSTLDAVWVNGDRERRVCNTTNLGFGDVDGVAMLSGLEAKGVICSQTSACTSHRPEPSHVLLAMGVARDAAYASLRFSVSEFTTRSDIGRAADIVVQTYEQLAPFARRKAG